MIGKLELTPTEEIIIKRMLNYSKEVNFPDLKTKKILTPNLTAKSGWLEKDIIERKPAPYTPNKRWDFLDESLDKKKGLIIIKKFEYIENKGRHGSKKVYTLDGSPEVTYALFDYFFRKGMIYEFMDSDYFKNSLLRNLFNMEYLMGKRKQDNIRELIGEAKQGKTTITPSLFIALNEDKNYDRVMKAKKEFGANRIMESCMLVDYLNCDNQKYSDEYFEILRTTKKKLRNTIS